PGRPRRETGFQGGRSQAQVRGDGGEPQQDGELLQLHRQLLEAELGPVRPEEGYRMRITVNGAPLALDVKGSGSLGELLAGADDLLDRAGSVIVSLRVDGEDVDADGYARFAEMPSASVSSVEIRAEYTAAIRARTIETLL